MWGNEMKSSLSNAGYFIVKISQEEGEKLKNQFVKIHRDIRKGTIALTSEIDEGAEDSLISKIKQKFPQSQFLTERTPPSNYKKIQNSDYLWVINSLDGRINFSRGHRNFSISIALVQNMQTNIGVIHIPMESVTYIATLESPNEIYTSKTNKLKDALVALDWPYNLRQREQVIEWASRLAPHIRQIKSTGSASSDLALVASGKIDAYIQLGTKPWHTLAGGLMVEKNGGRITTPEGDDRDPFNDRIFASNGILHDPILELINK